MEPSSAAHQDVIVGELALLDGRRQPNPAHMELLTPPRRANADRRHETLLIFLDLGGGGGAGLAQAMLEHFNRAYWRCSGPVTTALRQAVNAANAHLLAENRLLPISHRRRVGLVCAVLRDDIMYLAQVGPARALWVQRNKVVQFPQERRDQLPLGVTSGLNIRFSHTGFYGGERLLLTGDSWTDRIEDSELVEVLRGRTNGVEDLMLALEQQAGSGPFSALVVENPIATDSAPVSYAAAPSKRDTAMTLVSDTHVIGEPERSPHEHSSTPGPQRGRPDGAQTGREPVSDLHSSSQVPVTVGYAQQVVDEDEGGRSWLPSRPLVGFSVGKEHLDRSREGIRRIGFALLDASRAMLLRILPEPEPEPPKRQWRPRGVRTENVPMMAGIAVAIPLVIAFIVATFYLQRNDADRRTAFVSQARAAVEEARQAEAADVSSKWETALQVVEDALLTLPDDAELRSMRAEARDMLDRLESALRPELTLLSDYGPGTGRRLAASRMQVYVLDPVEGQVMRHLLDQSRTQLASEQQALVAYQGQTVGDAEIGLLRDIMWLPAGDAWANEALIILTDQDRLLQHNLSWGISRLPFAPYVDQQQMGILRTYAGKLYNLDPEQNQIWRYRYADEGFGEGEGYFTASRPDLTRAIDMAIDGAIYVLLDDGALLKFLGAEQQRFEVNGLPQPMDDPTAIVSEGDAVSGALYVADAGDGSIVALDKSGGFLHQIKAEGGALAGVEALAIEPDTRTLYILVDGRLYAMGLPILPESANSSQ